MKKIIFILAITTIAVRTSAQVPKKQSSGTTDWFTLISSLIPDENEGDARDWQKALIPKPGIKWNAKLPKKEKDYYTLKGNGRLSVDIEPDITILLYGKNIRGYSSFRLESTAMSTGEAINLQDFLGQSNFKSQILRSPKEANVITLSVYELKFPGKKTVWLFIDQVPVGRISDNDPTPYDRVIMSYFFDKNEYIARSNLTNAEIDSVFTRANGNPFLAKANELGQNAQIDSRNNLSKQKVNLTPAAAYIFNDVKTKLSNQDKNDLAKDYTIRYYDGTPELHIIIDVDEKTHDTTDTYASVHIYPTDLNNDGIEEILIDESDGWVKYHESHPAFYMKNKAGKYVVQLSWDDQTYVNGIYVSSRNNLEYPDLIIDGGEYYSWNGEKYIEKKHTNALKRKSTDKSIIEVSNAYVSSLPDSLLKKNIVSDEPEKKSSTPVEHSKSSSSKPESNNPSPEITAIAASLFSNVKTKLTNEEKYQIAWLTGIKQEELNAKTKRGKPKFELNIYPVDFNNDGEEEIFLCITTKPLVIPMHTYCFYAKNDAGKYKLAPGKIGQGARILLDGKTGFPDLIIGTPGFDREIWSWNGQTYQHVQNISGKTPIPYATKNIDDASKEYER